MVDFISFVVVISLHTLKEYSSHILIFS